jgi:hypothetical protein
VTFLTDTDLIAELIVLLPVEVFIMFKRTNYYTGVCAHQIYSPREVQIHTPQIATLFFVESAGVPQIIDKNVFQG